MALRRTLARTVAATGLIVSCLLLTQAGPATAAPAAGPAGPGKGDCSLIDFDKAAVLGATTNTVRRELVVTGTTSSTAVTVSLVPLTYIRQPEFWGIEVIGCRTGIGLPVLTPYTARLNIDATIGTIGVEVIGATRSQQIPLVVGNA